MSELTETLKLTDEEAVAQLTGALVELGAVYKSHNKHNIYIVVPKGALLDNEHYQKKAKQWTLMQVNRVLKIVDK